MVTKQNKLSDRARNAIQCIQTKKNQARTKILVYIFNGIAGPKAQVSPMASPGPSGAQTPVFDPSGCESIFALVPICTKNVSQSALVGYWPALVSIFESFIMVL